MTDQSLLDNLTRVVAGFAYSSGSHGPKVTALAVLGLPTIAQALEAADVVARLREMHHPVRWADDSETIVCAAACGAYPCPTAQILGGSDGPS